MLLPKGPSETVWFIILNTRKLTSPNLSCDDVHANDEEEKDGKEDLLSSLKLV